MQAEHIIDFWFNQHGAKDWYAANPDFDTEVSQKFSELLAQAGNGELAHWRQTPQGCLAEIIILDQFSRQIFRNTAKAFAFDELALQLAQAAVAAGMDKHLTPEQCSFLYMPYMHSEALEVHKAAVKLFTALGNQDNLDYEIRHMKIIERFGRYPHRNAILERESTNEELEFLKQPGSSF